MIKKAFIPGAGLGTRLRPLTSIVPKPLVPLFNRPLIEHAFDRLLALGVEDIAINTHHLPHVWEEHFPSVEESQWIGENGESCRSSQYQKACLSFFHEPSLLETGGGVKNVSRWIGHDDVLVYNGDIFSSIPLEPLVKQHKESGLAVTLLMRSEGPACGVALEGERVLDINGMLGNSAGTHQFTGIYVMSPMLLDFIPPFEKVSVIRAFLDLIKKKQLGAVVQDTGHWYDLGTREMYYDAHYASELIPEGAHRCLTVLNRFDKSQIQCSWIGDNVTIGPNSTISNSILWNGVTIPNNSLIENKIVLPSESGEYVLH